MTVLYFLLIFMIIATILAIELEDLISSVVALFSVGLALCITLIVLKAPDVAIMQLVVETLALVVLVKATSREDLPFSTSGRWYVNTFIYAAFFMTLFIVALKCFSDLPSFGSPLMKSAALLGRHLPQTRHSLFHIARRFNYPGQPGLCQRCAGAETTDRPGIVT